MTQTTGYMDPGPAELLGTLGQKFNSHDNFQLCLLYEAVMLGATASASQNLIGRL